jgi:hypothetical protein
MSKDLTKNARWIVLLRKDNEYNELLLNAGRWNYSVPTEKAIQESFKPNEYKEQHIFLVDVTLYKYEKDWKQVNELAKNYFVGQGLCSKDLYV